MVYAELRKSRFSNTTGSTQFEVYVCILLAICFNTSTSLWLNVRYRINKSNYSVRIFLLEFLGCICPLVISLTLLSNFVYIIFAFYVIVSVFSIFIVNVSSTNSSTSTKIIEQARLYDSKLPCISHFRGVVNLYSVICILCADFACFPKRYLKTEFYGYSLMDSGVGLFVVALSLASSPFASTRTAGSVLSRPLILLMMGIGRYLSIRSTNYHHQVFEYGVHWNFFLTLAIIAVFNELIFFVMKSVKKTAIFSVSLLIFYELVLTAGLKEWIIGSSPRSTFISANREGICSLVGYEVLYLWGVLIRYHLPRKEDTYQKYVGALSKYFFGLAILFVTNFFCEKYFGISRRCANCCYVFWITIITLMSLCSLILFELLVLIINNKTKMHISYTVPFIVESINFNGLLFFLFGNLLTGVINMKVNTLFVNDAWGFVTIISYVFICCSLAIILYLKNWRIR